jgi:thymidylate synthase
MYTVTRPDYGDIENLDVEWVKEEWKDRLTGNLNPGKAWKQRPEVWTQFLEKPNNYPHTFGKFAYTYSVRMGGNHLQRLIAELKLHPESRQLWLPVWDRNVDETRRGIHRVPCSLGYWFVQRRGELHLTYMMRSCDYATHYPNDIALASIMQHYVAKETGYTVGTFTHFVGSFHVFEKDVADVF